jgi:hypothetical protein
MFLFKPSLADRYAKLKMEQKRIESQLEDLRNEILAKHEAEIRGNKYVVTVLNQAQRQLNQPRLKQELGNIVDRFYDVISVTKVKVSPILR